MRKPKQTIPSTFYSSLPYLAFERIFNCRTRYHHRFVFNGNIQLLANYLVASGDGSKYLDRETSLDRIAARNYDVATERIDLGPVQKPWTAWLAARKA